ncbi:DUF4010 domain-containing protein [Bordetella sputigena]
MIGLSVALGCGLLVGIERERRMEQGPHRGYAGIRSFAAASLAGALAQTLSPMLVAAGAALIVLLSTASYIRERSDDIGITTEVALFATYLLGVNAIGRPGLSAAVAVVLAGLLFLREPLHRFSQEILTQAELRDGLLLAGAVLVVLPLLPDVPQPLLLGLNPRRLWTLATLILALQAVGYIGLRVGGARLGLTLSGFVSGLISSIATIATMGRRARTHPELASACLAAALLSNVATFVLLIAVALVIFPAALGILAVSLFSGLAAAIAVSAATLLRHHESGAAPVMEGRAFSVIQALAIAALLTAAAAVVAYVNDRVGDSAVTVAAALTGIVDAHVATGSVLLLGASGTLAQQDLWLAVLLAISTNSASKLVSAVVAGGAAFGARVGIGLLIILAATWLPYAWPRF